jgi:ABC-type sulfate transport system substrate-binding protein
MSFRTVSASQTPTRASSTTRRLGRVAGISALALTPLAFAAVPAGASGGTVGLVAYSTPKPAYTVLDADFAKTKAGSGVTISPSFGPSGTQATSVVDGLPADVVNFSLEPDMAKLVKAGLVSSSWDKGATKGMVTNSIVSFIVRPGNPKHITTWADLVKPGVGVITPNVFSSGSAKWNIMAAYGAEIHQGKSSAAAQTYLSQLLHHAVAQPTSASAALQTFLSGQVAVTKTASSSAKAFVSYLESPAGQKVWGQQGYRPVLASVAKQFKFPQPKTLFTIDSLGGWTSVNTKFFDPTNGIVAKVEQSLGVSTASS